MTKLNKTQKYAILWLQHLEHGSEKIAKELKLDPKQVSRFLANYTYPSIIGNEKTKTNNEPKSEQRIFETNNSLKIKKQPVAPQNFMINETAKKNRGVTIMTEAQSQRSDSARKNFNKTTKSQQGIFKPRG